MKLTAPAGMTGHVHTTGGRAYYIGEDGTIEAHHRDLGDLIRLGFSQDGTANDPPAPVASTFTQSFVDTPDGD
jgi:hypothetical protein